MVNILTELNYGYVAGQVNLFGPALVARPVRSTCFHISDC